jgi:hypothetical protein
MNINRLHSDQIKATLLLVVILSHTFITPLLSIPLFRNYEIVNSNAVNIFEQPCIEKNMPLNCQNSINTTAIKKAKSKKYLSNKYKQDGGGPSMPEVQGFTPVSADKMVDLSTGDLTYNIPLMDIGGYPVNLAYNSGIGVNDEASWVGLGWTLNAGAITRNVRGLPDDFAGEMIDQHMSIKERSTISYGPSLQLEISGADAASGISAAAGLGLNLEIEEDNYDGIGVKVGVDGSARFGGRNFGGSLGLGMGVNSRGGGYANPRCGLSGSFTHKGSNNKLGINAGLNIDSREGLKQVNYGISAETSLARHRKEITPFRSSNNFPISYSSPTYSPPFEISTYNSSGSLKLSIGSEGFSVNAGGDFVFNWSNQKIRKHQAKPAFGYVYSQRATSDALMDLNRERETVYQAEVPVLPVTSYTHDIYSITAQGMQSTCRPMRMDIGTLHDPAHQNKSESGSGGLEIGIGNLVKIGGDFNIDLSSDVGKKWESGNGLNDAFQYHESTDKIDYEPAYFKNLGEPTAMQDTALFNRLDAFDPVRPELSQADPTATANALNRLSNGQELDDRSTVKLSRDISTQRISWNTVGEMSQSNNGQTAYSEMNFRSGQRRNQNDTIPKKPNLIQEFTVTNESGTRYHYGLPVYNNFIKEVSFSVNKDSIENSNGIVGYTNQDASVENAQGEDHYFSSTTTPSHSYAWLLTSIVSSDYQDIDNNGPSPMDNGSYTNFKYIQTHQDFKWRIPFEHMKANFQEAQIHTKLDNKGSYIYGSKEIYYLEKIETRNYVAEFYSSPRKDGLASANEHGGVDTKFLNKLDSIKLFTIGEYNNPGNKIPLKTVYFEYDYSLCKGMVNTINLNNISENGKLTLKKLYFTYNNSKKHAKSPYIFNYSKNPNFNPTYVDRWGNYKVPQSLDNDRFPYCNQQKIIQDDQAKSWLLDSIYMPMGGNLKIEYESDDYAYVQNKKAMCMYQIAGFRDLTTTPLTNQLYNKETGAIHRYLYFKLPHDFVSNQTPAHLFEYFNSVQHLYFNLNMQLTNYSRGPQKFFELTGFIPMNLSQSDFGTIFGYDRRDTMLAWIKLPTVVINPDAELNNRPEYTYGWGNRTSTSRHPFTQAGFEYLKMSMPRFINHKAAEGEEYELPANLETALSNLGDAFEECFSGGTFNHLYNNHRCISIDTSQSFIRLNHPTGRKLGGGSRVKKVILHDNWGNMQKDAVITKLNFQYGVEYDYSNGSASSGVCSYEPMIGADENPFIEPIPMHITRPMANDVNKFQLAPVGGIFFPGPQVIYSKVTQRNLQYERVKQHGMGRTVTEYFTAKDFPTKVRYTDLRAIPKSFTLPLQIYNQSENTAVVSQGFVIELNDMHGKLKSVKEYDEFNNLITATENTYQTSSTGELDNYVNVINPMNGSISKRMLGVQFECIVDANNYISKTEGGGAQLNLDVAMPLQIVFMGMPRINRLIAEFRSITLTKLISRVGILSSTRTYKLGSQAEVVNLAYDPTTGQPIVVQQDNEFNTKYYTTNLPTHWAYKNLGHSNINEGIVLKNISLNSGQFSIPSQAEKFLEGDELRMTQLGTSIGDQRAWVFKTIADQVFLINANGETFGPNGRYDLKIIRSGNKNILASSVGNFISTQNPILTNRLVLTSDSILQSSASTLSDYWQTDFAVRSESNNAQCNCKYNPPLNLIPIVEFSGIDLKKETEQIKLDSNRVTFKDKITNCEIQIVTEDGRKFIVDYIDANTNWNIPAQATHDCIASNYVTAVLENSNTRRRQNIRMISDCFPLIDCNLSPGSTRVSCGEGVINPFLNGVFGNYRPLAEYVPVVKRTSGRIDRSGYYESYTPFWVFAENGLQVNSNLTNWQRTDSMIAYNSQGKIIESVDGLNIPSSTFYQFGKLLTGAVTANSHYTDMAYDGFEDRQFSISRLLPSASCVYPHHFAPTHNAVGTELHTIFNKEISHSGNTSMKLSPFHKAIYKYNTSQLELIRQSKSLRMNSNSFRSTSSDVIKTFSPKTNTDYLISVWVYQENENNFDASISINDRIIFRPSGPIIDGWQQINGEFKLSDTDAEIKIELNPGTKATYFDDIRIHPSESNMVSYTYSADKLRLDAVQNELNFTNFYEYDEEGKLRRSKKETELGIFTISESVSELPKLKP